jgi:hypothetical protein
MNNRGNNDDLDHHYGVFNGNFFLNDLRTSQENQNKIIRFDFESCFFVIDFERRMTSRKKSVLDNTSPMIWKTVSERKSSPGIEGLNLSSFDRPMAPTTEIRELRFEL